MGSTFTTMPEAYDQTSIFGTKKPMPVYLQFVPGVVVKTAPAQDNLMYKGDLKKISSIIAMPHETNLGVRKPSEAGEEFRYYPLLRGIQETPTVGDPVLLCTFAKTNYYIGPLNTHGSPTFNEDVFKSNYIKSSFNSVVKSEGSLKSDLFVDDYPAKRMQKWRNPILDIPSLINKKSADSSAFDTIHGDMLFEGRHGNSIRIGSRHINPYIIISNGRLSTGKPVETTLDGTILAILEKGSIRNHFNFDNNDYKFKLADDEIPKVNNSISKTFNKPLGHGGSGKIKPEASGPTFNSDNEIYNYKENQFFLSSDRITFNSRKESIFVSAREHIHIGSGNSMTFSTSKNIFTEAHESIVTNTKGQFEVNADAVWIDGAKRIVLGNPLANDSIEPAVLGESLVIQLSNILWLMKEMCYITSNAIEAKDGLPGGSLETMGEVLESINDMFGMTPNPIPMVGEYPKKISDLILSKKVKLKR